MLKNLQILILLTIFLPFLNSCAVFNQTDAREFPPEPEKRVKKNLEEGRGFTMMDAFSDKDKGGSGNFDFASSNELWRASLDTIDFMPLASANYSGGIIITDWYSENNNEESIKITIRFLSTEIRADGLDVIIHQKKCDPNNFSNCTVNKLNTKLEEDIKLAILKRAVLIDKKLTDKKVKEFKKQFPDFQRTGKASAN